MYNYIIIYIKFIILYPTFNLELLLLVSLIYMLYNKKLNLSHKKQQSILHILDQFYINYLYKNILYVIIYFLCSIGIFIILRINTLGKSFHINNITLNFNLIILVNFLFFIAILYFYKEIIKRIFYNEIYRFHLYLFKYQRYILYAEYIKDNYAYFSTIFSNIDFFIKQVSDPTYDLINYYRRSKEISKDLAYPKYTFILREFILSHKIFMKCCQLLNKTYSILRIYITPFLYYIPLIIIIIILIIDLTKGIIYYTFFALMFYLISQTIYKVRRFYFELDFLLDSLIHNYLYSTDHSYSLIQQIIKNKRYSINDKLIKVLSINSYFNDIFSQEELILKYIYNQFKVYYILENQLEINQIMRKCKTFIIISIITIVSLYMIFYIQISHPLLLALPLSIIYATLNKNLISLKIIHWFMLITQCIIISLIYIKHNICIYMSETIWSWGITISQRFTYQEKLEFIQQYLNMKLNHSTYTLLEKIQIITNITNLDFTTLITNETTLLQLKEFIDNIVLMTIALENQYVYMISKYITEIEQINNISDTMFNTTVMAIIIAVINYLIEDIDNKEPLKITYTKLWEVIKYFFR